MASSSVALYYGDTENVVYSLATTGPDKTTYRVAGRTLVAPQLLTIERKLQPSGSKSNDKVIVTLLVSDINATTGTIATGYVKTEISVPRDTTTMPAATISRLCKEMGSMLGENCGTCSADATTTPDKLVSGLDL